MYFNQNHNLSSVMFNGAIETDVLREHAIDKAILLKVAESLGLNIARGPCVLGHMVRASFLGLDKLEQVRDTLSHFLAEL